MVRNNENNGENVIARIDERSHDLPKFNSKIVNYKNNVKKQSNRSDAQAHLKKGR